MMKAWCKFSKWF